MSESDPKSVAMLPTTSCEAKPAAGEPTTDVSTVSDGRTAPPPQVPWDGVERRQRASPPGAGWDGQERRKSTPSEVDELRQRIVGRLEHRRLTYRIAAHSAVFMLAMLAAFGACWIATLVLRGAAISPELAHAMKVGGMVASGTAAVIGAVVSWRVGWRSFFVGWLVGGKLYLAAMLMGF